LIFFGDLGRSGAVDPFPPRAFATAAFGPHCIAPSSSPIFSTDTFGMSVTTPTIDLLSRLLDAAGTRHRVIAHNIANVNTPGFRRFDVLFEDSLAAQVKLGTPTAAKIEVVESDDPAVRADGNSVDIDREMGRLNKNAVIYNTLAQLLTSQIGQMRSAITGR
jgi:flagellar basal-body rod protein FlgB